MPSPTLPEMLEVSRFLAAHAPFAGLPAEEIERVANAVQVEFFPAGTVILDQGGLPSAFAYVIRRGEVELVDGDQAVDVLEEGEMFGFPSLLSGKSPLFTARAADDTICYLMDAEVAASVLDVPTVAGFLAGRLQTRAFAGARPLLERFRRVGELASSPLIVVEESTSVAEAAARMTEEGASAVVVRLGEDIGIVTDRDVRARVVAAGRDPGVTVGEVVTRGVRTVRADALAEEALADMLELGVHHLPVSEGEHLVGMLTDLDILRLEQSVAFRLRSEIGRATDVDGVVAAGRRIPEVAVALVRAGFESMRIGRVLAVLVDAMTIRLLDLAFERHGPPPVAWSWLSLGSLARREQGLASDQDHALVYADGGEAADGLFAEIAGFVVSGLEAGGLPPCPSQVMASHPAWRGPSSWWRTRLITTMASADRHATFYAGLDLDVRPVAGDLDARALFADVAAAAPGYPGFLRRLAGLVSELAVPIGFLGNLVTIDSTGHHDVLDVKHGGLLPITDFARLVALEAGVAAVETVPRLRAAAEAGTVDRDLGAALEEALAVLLQIRLEHQATQWEAGDPPDSLVRPDALGRLERLRLKDALAVVREARSAAVERAAPRLLGR